MRRKFLPVVILLFCMSAFAQRADDAEYVFVDGERSVLARLEFSGDSDTLTPQSLENLIDITSAFLDGDMRRYEVHGHFCAGVDGSRRIAVSRIETLVEYLVMIGVSERRILTTINPTGQQRGAARCPADKRVDIMSVELRRVRKSNVVATDVIVDESIAEEIVAAAAPVAPTAPTAPVAPMESAAQGRVTVAVYMAGDEPSAIRGMHGILAGELVRAISASEKFIAVDRTDIILEQLAREHEYQRSGAVDDDQIRALGRQLGVQYLCISTVVSVGNGFYVDTRLVDVVTARVIRSVTATSNLPDATEAMRVARETAHELIETEHANRCGRGEETAYNPAYQFCFGGRAYNLCGGGGYNPLTQGCIAGQEVGTKCADGSIVSLGTHCGRHALSTNVAPPIGGTVIRTPDAQVYSADASVALSAVAARGFEFAGWAGAQTSSETSINIRMTRDMPFVAMFRPLNNNTLITSAFPANGGTITRVPESDIYESGEVVAVTAIPARGFEFAGWEGASSSTSRTVNIMIDEGKTLVAIFKPNLHTLNAYATPDIGGSVFINGTALMAATSASSDDFGNMIEAFAQPATGYVFAGWSGDVSGTVNPIMVDISHSNRTVVANFTPQVIRSASDTRIVAVSRNESVQYLVAPSAATTLNASQLLAQGEAQHHIAPAATTTTTSPPTISPQSVVRGSFIDPRDNQTYRTVRIGNLTWMAENLNYLTRDSWCYGNDDSNCARYGRLYTWTAAMDINRRFRNRRWNGNDTNHQGICPVGWRVPNNADWDNLVNAIGGYRVAGRHLKSQTNWRQAHNRTDDYDFSALPGGGRWGSRFGHVGLRGYWWSATEDYANIARYRDMSYIIDIVDSRLGYKNYAHSLRCVMD